jgi:hypothetical protein
MLVGGNQNQRLAMVNEVVRIAGVFADRIGEEAVSQAQSRDQANKSHVVPISDYPTHMDLSGGTSVA